MDVAILLTTLFTGLSIGSILLLAALGLTFTFGQMGVINMAHGEFIMAGAYTAYVVQKVVSDPTTSLLIALPVAFVVAGSMGAFLEWSLIRRLYSRPLDTLLATYGVSLILQQVARKFFGTTAVEVKAPSYLGGALNIGDVSLPYSRIVILGLVLVTILAVAVVLTRLPLGRKIRAVVQNRQLAAVAGLPTARIDRLTFFLGSGLAGIAGVSITLLGAITPTLGTQYIVNAFLIVIVGGLGQLRGAVIAALVLGLLNAYSAYKWDDSLALVIVFVTIIAFLQVRPQGLVVLKSRSLA